MSTSSLPKTDIYGITASELSLGRSNEDVVRQMLAAGIKIIQYREKEFNKRQKYRECLAIRGLCAEYEACFIVNDDIDIALAVRADGVHVGQEDLPVEKVREIVGERMIIGLSVTTRAEADEAINSGAADYLGAGPVFPTGTKRDAAPPTGLEFLDYIAARTRIPIVAIGGINRDNLASVLAHGACCAAIISEIVSAPDIAARVREITNILHK